MAMFSDYQARDWFGQQMAWERERLQKKIDSIHQEGLAQQILSQQGMAQQASQPQKSPSKLLLLEDL